MHLCRQLLLAMAVHLGLFANSISTMQVAADYLSAVRSAASLSGASSPQRTSANVSQRGFENAKGISKSDWEKVFQRGVELAAGLPTDHFLQVSDLSNPSWNAPQSQVGSCNRHAVTSQCQILQRQVHRVCGNIKHFVEVGEVLHCHCEVPVVYGDLKDR